ncbi:putative ulp1 protease family protein [Phaeomoniella chlamydospora]|uniref:Putative ulp1 protease family protein n=1 Tax=Phaeomoniella chlamydospora TaxID=158046 RepID=A0A0G2GWY1_PHACM|nr:putative ulp1 protease family protein [Phaeomoniella chlamydospora]
MALTMTPARPGPRGSPMDWTPAVKCTPTPTGRLSSSKRSSSTAFNESSTGFSPDFRNNWPAFFTGGAQQPAFNNALGAPNTSNSPGTVTSHFTQVQQVPDHANSATHTGMRMLAKPSYRLFGARTVHNGRANSSSLSQQRATGPLGQDRRSTTFTPQTYDHWLRPNNHTRPNSYVRSADDPREPSIADQFHNFMPPTSSAKPIFPGWTYRQQAPNSAKDSTLQEHNANANMPGEWPDSLNESQLVYNSTESPTIITRIAVITQGVKRRCVDVTHRAADHSRNQMYLIVRAVRRIQLLNSRVASSVTTSLARCGQALSNSICGFLVAKQSRRQRDLKTSPSEHHHDPMETDTYVPATMSRNDQTFIDTASTSSAAEADRSRRMREIMEALHKPVDHLSDPSVIEEPDPINEDVSDDYNNYNEEYSDISSTVPTGDSTLALMTEPSDASSQGVPSTRSDSRSGSSFNIPVGGSTLPRDVENFNGRSTLVPARGSTLAPGLHGRDPMSPPEQIRSSTAHNAYELSYLSSLNPIDDYSEISSTVPADDSIIARNSQESIHASEELPDDAVHKENDTISIPKLDPTLGLVNDESTGLEDDLYAEFSLLSELETQAENRPEMHLEGESKIKHVADPHINSKSETKSEVEVKPSSKLVLTALPTRTRGQIIIPSPEISDQRQTRLQKKKAEEEAAAKKLEYELRRKPFLPLSPEQDIAVTDVLMKGFGKFSRTDLVRVVPTGRGGGTEGWLNDEVINEYLTLICTHGNSRSASSVGKKYHAFSSYFYNNIMQKGYSSVSRWAKRAKLDAKTILDMEAIYVPVNSGSHWTLLAIRPATKSVQYFDSLGGSGRNAMSVAKQWLSGELGPQYQEAAWSFEATSESPQQDNYSDCGVFTITTAKMLTLGISPLAYGPADIPNVRRKIVAELLGGGLF